jgi:hypothetical protein
MLTLTLPIRHQGICSTCVKGYSSPSPLMRTTCKLRVNLLPLPDR